MKLYVYEGRRRGQWYWRLRARNGRIVAVGGEAFTSARKALASYERVGSGVDGEHLERTALRSWQP
jgi:uncharacterized protein YegP (UPF0339 family)